MLTFFISLFVISLVVIIILHYKIQKEKTKKLLHDFKKSCNINSVQFEKRLQIYFCFFQRILKSILEKKDRVLNSIKKYQEKIIYSIKKKLRNKLFEQGQEETVSYHLSSIRDDIHKQS